ACAGLCVCWKNCEPAVVITPCMSVLSFTASRNRLLLVHAGEYSMKARLPESFLLMSGVNEHPLHRTSKASATANRLKITRTKYSTRTRLGGGERFANADRQK